MLLWVSEISSQAYESLLQKCPRQNLSHSVHVDPIVWLSMLLTWTMHSVHADKSDVHHHLRHGPSVVLIQIHPANSSIPAAQSRQKHNIVILTNYMLAHTPLLTTV